MGLGAEKKGESLWESKRRNQDFSFQIDHRKFFREDPAEKEKELLGRTGKFARIPKILFNVRA